MKILEKHPEIKVLLTSGFTDNTVVSDVRRRFSTVILDKPYRKDDLVRRVREVLDQ
ncbi:MAG: hypothetical protein GY792_18920 [Gammaproteobacteria bacterium]|nr:hypothetical protein [Gammaproteobacteria bacterium]